MIKWIVPYSFGDANIPHFIRYPTLSLQNLKKGKKSLKKNTTKKHWYNICYIFLSCPDQKQIHHRKFANDTLLLITCLLQL